MNTLTKKKKIFLAVDFCLIIFLVFLDQFTKYLAVVHLQDKPAFKIINGVDSGFWKLGKTFMEKYQFVFNYDSKTFGFIELND